MRATRRAGTELRSLMRDRLFNPGPMNEGEMADFALFLTFQGVPVIWSRKHPGAFSSDRDLCPYVWQWRIQRGEVRERAA